MEFINKLQYDSTLSSLPLFSASLQLDDPCSRISQHFDEDPRLPAVLLFDKDNFSAMVSRRSFLETMNLPYSKDLFSQRKIRKIANHFSSSPMAFSADTFIGKAVTDSLSRSIDQLSDPLVVVNNHNYFILDIHLLLRAHALIFSATVKKLNAEILHSNLLREKLELARQEAEQTARRDGLTGIANRRHMDEYLSSEWNRAIRDKSPLSVILLDIDYFKLFNDRYGHQMGDKALSDVAHTLKSRVHRPADLVARYGGEEFLLILPVTPLEGAQSLAEMLRQAILELKIPHSDSRCGEFLSVSCGVSSLIPSNLDCMDKVVQLADTALYEAKHKGRNCVALMPPQ